MNGDGRVAANRTPEGAEHSHRGRARTGRLYTWAQSLGLLAIVVGAGLTAPNLIQANGWSRDHRFASVETATVPAPAAATSDLLSGAAQVPARPPTPAAEGPVNGVDFDIVIPALGYRATVLEGTGAGVLARGPGHYTSTAWPGRAGNVGIAAHNTYWIALGNLEPGDRVEIQTRHGVFTYAIRYVTIVNPDDRTALAATADHRLTLTTCYPLWAGAWATQRMIFAAVEIDSAG